MIYLAVAIFVAAGVFLGRYIARRFPAAGCLLFGHDENMDRVKIVGDLKWHCAHCGKEVGPL